MEEVIRKIISIENEAQNIISNAEQEKQLKRNELEERLKSLEKKLMQDAHNKVIKLRETELEIAAVEAEKIVSACSSKLECIARTYDENGEKWAVELTNSVLKR